MTAVTRLWSIHLRGALGRDESWAFFMAKQVQQLLWYGGADGWWQWCGIKFECVLCCSSLKLLPLFALLSFCSCLLRAEVMRLPREFLAPEVQSQSIIIIAIHQRQGCNFEQMRGKKRNLKITDWGERKWSMEPVYSPSACFCLNVLCCYPFPIFVACASLPTESVLTTSTVWLQKPQFSVILSERDYAKHSAPFPINDDALGSKVPSNYQEGRLVSQDKVCTTVFHITIDN